MQCVSTSSDTLYLPATAQGCQRKLAPGKNRKNFHLPSIILVSHSPKLFPWFFKNVWKRWQNQLPTQIIILIKPSTLYLKPCDNPDSLKSGWWTPIHYPLGHYASFIVNDLNFIFFSCVLFACFPYDVLLQNFLV